MDDVTLGLDMDHAEATLLPAAGAAPPATGTPADAPTPASSQAQEASADSPDRRKEMADPFAGQSQSPPQQPPPGDEFLRVSRQCRATKCFRLQWEVESASRASFRSALDAQ